MKRKEGHRVEAKGNEMEERERKGKEVLKERGERWKGERIREGRQGKK